MTGPRQWQAAARLKQLMHSLVLRHGDACRLLAVKYATRIMAKPASPAATARATAQGPRVVDVGGAAAADR